MHWESFPKTTHNEDAIREYEQAESRRIKRWLVRLVIALPILLLVGWLLFH